MAMLSDSVTSALPPQMAEPPQTALRVRQTKGLRRQAGEQMTQIEAVAAPLGAIHQ